MLLLRLSGGAVYGVWCGALQCTHSNITYRCCEASPGLPPSIWERIRLAMRGSMPAASPMSLPLRAIEPPSALPGGGSPPRLSRPALIAAT